MKINKILTIIFIFLLLSVNYIQANPVDDLLNSGHIVLNNIDGDTVFIEINTKLYSELSSDGKLGLCAYFSQKYSKPRVQLWKMGTSGSNPFDLLVVFDKNKNKFKIYR